jgi:hypothetical protein
MPVGINNVHTFKNGIYCECAAHREARAAGAKAHEISVAMLEAYKAGDEKKSDELCNELERLNAIARQCDND